MGSAATSIYIACSPKDIRYHDELVQHLSALGSDAFSVTSRLALPLGSIVEERVKDALIRSEVIVILVTVNLFNDDLCRNIEIPRALARHGARDAVVRVVQCSPVALDARLKELPRPLKPENFKNWQEFWYTCAQELRAAAAEIQSGAVSGWVRRPQHEDEHTRRIADELSTLHWEKVFDNRSDETRIAKLRSELQRGGRARAGDILMDRYQLWTRRSATAAHERWDAYDRIGERPVSVHFLKGFDEAAARRNQRDLAARAKIEHPSILKVLSNLHREPAFGAWVYVTELGLGRALRSVVLDREAETRDILEALASVAEGLEEAGDRGITLGGVHLDALYYTPAAAGTRPSLRLEPSVLGAPAEAARDDLSSLIEVIAFCLYGSVFPHGMRDQELREIIVGSQCDLELKQLLVIQLSARDATALRRAPRFAQRYRKIVSGVRIVERAALDVDCEMIEVDATEMWLGARTDDPYAPEGRKTHEKPARRFKIGAFWIAKYPVTQRLYRAVMGHNPSTHQGECLPVHDVSFRDAVTFCNMMSLQECLTPAYRVNCAKIEWAVDADGYRLPTEIEWELCAKGPNRYLFPWGDDEPGARISWRGSGNAVGYLNRRRPAPVWNHPDGKSPYGALDMSGNVWEWCWDKYSPYQSWDIDPNIAVIDEVMGPELSITPRPTQEAIVAEEGERYRVMRGGAWNLERADLMRTTERCTDREDRRGEALGFRLARGPKPGLRCVKLK